MMRGVVALVMCVLVGVTTMAGAHPPSQLNTDGEKGVAEEIADFRKRVADAVTAKDKAKLETMFAKSFRHTDADVSDDKDAHIAKLLVDEFAIESAPATNVTVRGHAGGWAATAFGTARMKAKSDGRTYTVHWSAFYARTETSWELVANHATREAEVEK